MNIKGKVFLVGAGPGDPELLTVKALRIIQQADTVVYDRLVSDEILQLIPAGTTLVHVGKTTNQHTLCQDEICSLLVKLGLKGQLTVRLKGGDPFIFGRGGEEALALARASVPFEVVPGITAAQACSAYAGIPLTHRGLAQGVQFITGHRKDNETLMLDSSLLADDNQTLVFYMGLANVHLITRELQNAGRSSDTPVAVIEHGTTNQQRLINTTIGQLESVIAGNEIKSPTLLIVGEVVTLAAELGWFRATIDDRLCRYA